MRYFEQWGAEHAADLAYYRDKLDKFMADWKNWKLDRIWTRPEDYFTDSERNMVKLRGRPAMRCVPIPIWRATTFVLLRKPDRMASGS